MSQNKPIKYGDVFSVSGEIGDKPVAPQDAATMQSAESQVLGHTVKGGPAAVMQSAATRNVQAQAVPRGACTATATHDGVAVTQTEVDGHRVITESIGDQGTIYNPNICASVHIPYIIVSSKVVARYADPNANPNQGRPPSSVEVEAVTLGEALEVTAMNVWDKPVTQADAAAIQAAEMQATGRSDPPPYRLGSLAQSAVALNKQIAVDENKTTLGDILTDATMKLENDKPAMVEDAEKVVAAELRNNPNRQSNLGGVGDTVAAAARLNNENSIH